MEELNSSNSASPVQGEGSRIEVDSTSTNSNQIEDAMEVDSVDEDEEMLGNESESEGAGAEGGVVENRKRKKMEEEEQVNVVKKAKESLPLSALPSFIGRNRILIGGQMSEGETSALTKNFMKVVSEESNKVSSTRFSPLGLRRIFTLVGPYTGVLPWKELASKMGLDSALRSVLKLTSPSVPDTTSPWLNTIRNLFNSQCIPLPRVIRNDYVENLLKVLTPENNLGVVKDKVVIVLGLCAAGPVDLVSVIGNEIPVSAPNGTYLVIGNLIGHLNNLCNIVGCNTVFVPANFQSDCDEDPSNYSETTRSTENKDHLRLAVSKKRCPRKSDTFALDTLGIRALLKVLNDNGMTLIAAVAYSNLAALAIGSDPTKVLKLEENKEWEGFQAFQEFKRANDGLPVYISQHLERIAEGAAGSTETKISMGDIFLLILIDIMQCFFLGLEKSNFFSLLRTRLDVENTNGQLWLIVIKHLLSTIEAPVFKNSKARKYQISELPDSIFFIGQAEFSRLWNNGSELTLAVIRNVAEGN